MGVIYCLFSTEDGTPRYVGQTRGDAARRLKQHLAAALDKEERGAVCDWIRDVLRRGGTIAVRVIQEDVPPMELDMFEAYWIEQFVGLLNSCTSSRRSCSPTAQKIVDAIRSEIGSPVL
jgi:hypothetical protein